MDCTSSIGVRFFFRLELWRAIACWQENEAELEKGQTRWRKVRSHPSAVSKISSIPPHLMNPAVPALGQTRFDIMSNLFDEVSNG